VSTPSRSPRRSCSVSPFPCTFGGRPHRIPISLPLSDLFAVAVTIASSIRASAQPTTSSRQAKTSSPGDSRCGTVSREPLPVAGDAPEELRPRRPERRRLPL
jgi:hypothetical protein